MHVTVLYFAGLKESLGCSEEKVEWAGQGTVADLQAQLVAAGRSALATVKNLRCAVNQDMVSLDAQVVAGDEVAFFPPVTGG